MRKLVIANWKMHYGPVKAGAWVRAFRRERLPKDLDIGIAVPHVSLAAARASLGRAGVPLLGAQNAFWADEGAYTGETSPEMLKEFGVNLCLVGHSERRIHLGETDAMVAKKIVALQKAGIQPVVCVGESAADRKKGLATKVVKAELIASLGDAKGTGSLAPVIAYEPIWAIGTGKPCNPEDARDMHAAIREQLGKLWGSKSAAEARIIYGGSVDARSVAEYLSTTGVDGALVGGASLDPRAFGLLCRAAVPA